jgi:hypothetical protein
MMKENQDNFKHLERINKPTTTKLDYTPRQSEAYKKDRIQKMNERKKAEKELFQ